MKTRSLKLWAILGALVLTSVWSWSAETSTDTTVSTDSIQHKIESAQKSLDQQNYDKALAELIEVIKQQQKTIDSMKNSTVLPPAPGPNATQEEKDSFLKQVSKSIPFLGADIGDVEYQWQKAYDLQHKAVFDMSRKQAIPVFEEAIKEYRRLIEMYPQSRRAPQATRQIGWILQTQLKRKEEAKIEWNTILTKYPNSPYVADARKYLGQ